MSVAIFGGGIAGCTIAHLLCKDYKVHLFESSNQLGGFVKTFRNSKNIPQEHSPRIMLNDYFLMERIFKDLNIEDNLINNPDDIVFPLFEKPHNILDFTKISLTIKEIVILAYYIIKGFFSTEEQLDYTDSIPIYDIIKSSEGRKWFNTLSLVAGERPDIMPLYKVIKMVESNVYNMFRKPKTLNGPWSEKFFNIWEKYLKENNVIIHYNTPLKQFDSNIKYAIVEKKGELRYLTADIFVLTSDITNTIKIFNKTKNKKLKELNKQLKELNCKTKSYQMGMQIAFPEKIKTKYKDYFTIQSDWQLIVQMQDTVWKEKMEKSLWSVVIPEMSLYSHRLKKKAEDCSEEEIKEEIIYQLRLKFDLPKPDNIYIWPAWSIKNNKWTTTEPYFWNSVNTKKLRPKQYIFDNLYLGGAYTDTNYYSYYMEGAVESGFKIAEKILGKKLNIPTRRFPLLLRLVVLVLLFSALGFFL